jgi:tRNA1Val (adenine37-N6)-methyltransferase
MKVCTDACLFGAWLASVIHGRNIDILDIGTGTGLLSLMLAQQSEGNIDAIEVDESACGQAKENFLAAPWNDRLSLYHDDIRSFEPSKKYDLIICNPPFYENELKSPDRRRNIALHDAGLTIAELMPIAKRLLKVSGRFAILLPAARADEMESLAIANDYKIAHKCLVRQTPQHGPFRVMYILQQVAPENFISEEIIIKQGDVYTTEFYALLKDYYLFESKKI